MDIKLVFKNQKGKRVNINKRSKLKAYFTVKGSKKLFPLIGEGDLEHYPQQFKYKNLGDFKSRLKQRARILADDFVSAGIIKKPDIIYYDRKSKQRVSITSREEDYTKNKKSYRREHYVYKGTSKVNQKNILDFLGLNKFMDKRRFGKVSINFKFTPEDKKGFVSLGKDAPVVKIADLHRSMLNAKKKFPRKLLRKMGFDVINHVYFSLRNQLWRRMWSITPQAFKFDSEIAKQRQEKVAPVYDKNGFPVVNKRTGKVKYRRVGYAPGRHNELKKHFNIDIQINYEVKKKLKKKKRIKKKK